MKKEDFHRIQNIRQEFRCHFPRQKPICIFIRIFPKGNNQLLNLLVKFVRSLVLRLRNQKHQPLSVKNVIGQTRLV